MQTVTGEQLSLVEYNEESKPGDSLEILCAIVNRLSLIDVDPPSRAKLVSHTGDDAQTIMHCLQTVSTTLGSETWLSRKCADIGCSVTDRSSPSPARCDQDAPRYLQSHKFIAYFVLYSRDHSHPLSSARWGSKHLPRHAQGKLWPSRNCAPQGIPR